ncbi:MAG: site-2 protease family protein [Fuerstiella sp.]
MSESGHDLTTDYHDDSHDRVALDAAETAPVIIAGQLTPEEQAIQRLNDQMAARLAWESWHRHKRRRLRISAILFVLTFLSTTLVGADYWPLDIMPGFFSDEARVQILTHLARIWPTEPGQTLTISDRFWESVRLGCTYSCPLMLILLCHEMGHYLQAVRYGVPASFPYFIPLPLPPLGTMGAVILQGRGSANRKMMFDIAVTGPIAGLIVTVPILLFGVSSSGYVPASPQAGFEFGQPYIVHWIIEAIHGPAAPGMVFHWNGYATAGWVGVFITAMNLLPIGQLDGGHIMYTLIGRRAHWIAWGLILTAVAAMIRMEMYSYVLLLILLTLTGPSHPPTADDTVPLGQNRHIVGWATLAFLIIGFTFQPIVIPDQRQDRQAKPVIEPQRGNELQQVDQEEFVQSSHHLFDDATVLDGLCEHTLGTADEAQHQTPLSSLRFPVVVVNGCFRRDRVAGGWTERSEGSPGVSLTPTAGHPMSILPIAPLCTNLHPVRVSS